MRQKSILKRIFRNRTTLCLVVAAALLSALEVALPFFPDIMPRGLFAALSTVAVSGAFVARLLAQKEVDDGR